MLPTSCHLDFSRPLTCQFCRLYRKTIRRWQNIRDFTVLNSAVHKYRRILWSECAVYNMFTLKIQEKKIFGMYDVCMQFCPLILTLECNMYFLYLTPKMFFFHCVFNPAYIVNLQIQGDAFFHRQLVYIFTNMCRVLRMGQANRQTSGNFEFQSKSEDLSKSLNNF